MPFPQDIFNRATIRGVADYLLNGPAPDEENRDYETRLEDAYNEYAQKVSQFDNNKNARLLEYANKMTSEVAAVYGEIGIQAGILLMNDFEHNGYEKESTADYQTMYNSLFKDITSALKLLQDVQEENAKEAREILKSAQCITEEIYMDSENKAKEK